MHAEPNTPCCTGGRSAGRQRRCAAPSAAYLLSGSLDLRRVASFQTPTLSHLGTSFQTPTSSFGKTHRVPVSVLHSPVLATRTRVSAEIAEPAEIDKQGPDTPAASPFEDNFSDQHRWRDPPALLEALRARRTNPGSLPSLPSLPSVQNLFPSCRLAYVSSGTLG